MLTTAGPVTRPLIPDVETEPQSLAVAQDSAAMVPAGDNVALMFERLARDPAVDVEKLERLIALQERIMHHNAKAAFDGAFARMQSELPEISERGQILVKGVLRSTYARLEDIHAEVKLILKKFGFAVRHRTEWPADKAGIIRIVGILSHEQGHSEESCFEAPMDRSDYRTDIQSMGSTVSYGRRYTTLDLLNIVTRNADDDGKTAGRPQAPPAPAGFDSWWTDLQATADNGSSALEQAWKASKTDFRNYVVQHHRETWSALKAKAEKVKAS